MEPLSKNTKEAVRKAEEKGINYILTIGAGQGFDGNISAIKVAESLENVYAAVGIHPNDIDFINDACMLEMELLLTNPKVVAIGEVGLDFHYRNDNAKNQTEVFSYFINLARDRKMPILIHSRDARKETLNMLRDVGRGEVFGICHCYSYDLDTAKKLVDMGFVVSFAGNLTFKNAQCLREIARSLPLERVLIETDAPFLAPVPFRGKTNEPAFLLETAKYLANLKNLDLCELARITTKTAFDVLGIEEVLKDKLG